MTQEHIDYLEKRLGISKKPVTARFLSRKWTVPAKEASEIMHHFYTSHQTDSVFKDLSIKYSVCGKQKAVKKMDKEENFERHADVLVKIVDKDDLNDSIEKLFSSVVSCQMYSMHLQSAVSLTNIIDTCTTNKWSFSEENMTKCGILQTATNGILEQPEEQQEDRPARRAQTEPLKAQNSIHIEDKSESKTQDKTESKTKAKMEDHDKSRPVYVSRKASSNPTPSTSASTKISTEARKPLYTSRKRNKEPAEVGNKDISSATSSKRAKLSSQAERKKQEDEKKELAKMLEDDFSDDAFENVNQGDDDSTVEKETEYKYDDIDIAEPEEEKSNEAQGKTMHESQEETEATLENISEDDVAENPATISSNQPAEPQPDVETYVDADGYVVRKVNRKTAKPAQSSTTPAKSSYTIDTKPLKNKGGNSARKQSNLMSFFKKKD